MKRLIFIILLLSSTTAYAETIKSGETTRHIEVGKERVKIYDEDRLYIGSATKTADGYKTYDKDHHYTGKVKVWH